MSVELIFKSNASKIVKELDGLSKAETEVATELKKMEGINKKVFDDGATKAGKYNAKIDKTKKSVKETNTVLTKGDSVAKKLGGTMKETFSQSLGPFNSQLTSAYNGFIGLTKGITGTSKGLKILKIALASTGILLLVGLFASLIAYFKSSEEGATKFAQVMAPLKILFGNISDLGVSLGETLVNVFTNPKKSISELWEFIKTNIMNRFTGIADSFSALGGVIESAFKLDWDGVKDNSAKLGESLTQTLTGVDNLGAKIKATYNSAVDSVGKLIEETKRESKEAIAVEEAKLKLIKAKRVATVRNAEIDAEVAKLRVKARDEENFTDKERLEFLDKAIALENEKMGIQQQIVAEKLRIKQLEDSFSTSSEEDLNEEAALQAELINLQTNNANAQRRLAMERLTLVKAINTTEKKENADTTKEDMDGKLSAFDLDQEIAEKKKALELEQLDDKNKIEQYKTEFELEQQKTRLKFMIDNGYAKNEKELELLKLLMKGIDKELANVKAGSGSDEFSFWKLIGLDPDNDEDQKKMEAAQMFADEMITQIGAIAQARVDAAAAEVEAIDSKIERQESALDRETALQAAGKANSVETEKKKLAALEKERQKALKQQEKAKKAQLNIDAALQLSGMITSSVNIFKVMSKIPFVGVPLAIAMIATMFGAFASAQSSARKSVESTKYAKGGSGKVVNGRLHSDGGEPLLDQVEVEDGENIFITKRTQTKKFAPLLNAINNDNEKGIASWFNKRYSKMGSVNHGLADKISQRETDVYKFERNQKLSFEDSSIRENTRAMKHLIEKMDRQGSRYVEGDKIIEKHGNTTRIINQNV